MTLEGSLKVIQYKALFGNRMKNVATLVTLYFKHLYFQREPLHGYLLHASIPPYNPASPLALHNCNLLLHRAAETA